jgi:hypothetical protein
LFQVLLIPRMVLVSVNGLRPWITVFSNQKYMIYPIYPHHR